MAKTIVQQPEWDQLDPAEVRKGIEAFCRLIRDIEELPGVRRPGFKPGADHSMSFDYVGAERLIHERLGSEEFEGEGRYIGYIRALANCLTGVANGIDSGENGLIADQVLEDFALLEGSTVPAQAAPHDGAPLGRLSTEQVQTLLSQIATQANALGSMARKAAVEAGRTPAAESCFVIAMGVDRIGATADWALGGDCVGSFEEWMLSPTLLESEARHG